MKRQFVFVALSISLSCASGLLAGCGGGDGTIDSCVSTYTGTFTGSSDDGPSDGRIVGVVQGEFINERGDQAGPLVSLTFVFDTKPDSAGNPTTGTASAGLMADGTLGAGSGLTLAGSVDLEACEGSGTWEGNAFQGSGEWRISIPDTAF